ncbi:MAG: 50S ribosomal protein L11 methyltransferase [Gammaproteobacteria bacterium]|nr:50S ribosomal protein L11 methyltransferase [Gammaproteobacteria bacterium]
MAESLKNMPWLQYKITTTDQYADDIGDQLQQFGAEAVTFEDTFDNPIYEPLPGDITFWKNTTVSALFQIKTDTSGIARWLQLKKDIGMINEIHCSTLQDQDWERVCLQDVKPIQIGQRLWICPTWETPPDPKAVNLMLDPGLAFGTGTHPTTALCLAWLDTHIRGGETIIDYGCGSGILGLAALKLGAKHVTAIDLDPQAVSATLENAKRNSIPSAMLDVRLPDQDSNNLQPASILIANILLQPLLTLAPHFATLTQPNAHLLLSGILSTQIDKIIQTYSEWFIFTSPAMIKADWACVSATRKPIN